MIANLPYRPNVCMLLFNPEYRLFLGERLGFSSAWQFPQGGVEPELTLEQNVIKELMEEVGVEPHHLKIEKKCDYTHQYDFAFTPKYYEGKFRGQSQTFWIVRFLGADEDVNISTAHPEFQDWRWATPEEVVALAEPIRLPSYREVVKEYLAFVESNSKGERE